MPRGRGSSGGKKKESKASKSKLLLEPSAIPSTGRPTLAFAFQPDPEDTVVKLFNRTGGQCFKCAAKTKQKDMLQSQCGCFVCKDCFLQECFCEEKFAEQQNECQQVNGGKLTAAKPKAADYKAVSRTNADIQLGGLQFELECKFFEVKKKKK